jgi:branched-chain amino acid aminotransferase/4-amino-4-deoxychorismate lyase
MDDRGLLVGDGLFETMLWANGALVLAAEHARRLSASAEVIGLPTPSADAFTACAEAAVRRVGLEAGRAAVRVTLTAGSGGRGLDRPNPLRPRLFATATAYAPPTGPASLALASAPRNEASPLSRVKSLNYLDLVLARREAAAAGADEAVLVNTRGELACAAVANLFWVRERRLFTPPIEAGCLPGVTRALVLETATGRGIEVELVREPPKVLELADAVFLTNSLMGVRAVSSYCGRQYAKSALVAAIAASIEKPV